MLQRHETNGWKTTKFWAGGEDQISDQCRQEVWDRLQVRIQGGEFQRISVELPGTTFVSTLRGPSGRELYGRPKLNNVKDKV